MNKTSENVLRKITLPSLTRLGMEINGVFLHEQILNCVVWGKNESKFLDLLSQNEKRDVLIKIFEKNPPVFLLSNNFCCEKTLLELNETYNHNRTAIIRLEFTTTEAFTLIGAWLAKTFAIWTTVHGSVISIFGEGTLIIGEPAIGKSEICLELLKMNHLFLADDAINIARFGNTIMAKPHSICNNFIQIRGLGILNVKEMYGGMKIIDETTITAIIELKHALDSCDLQSNFENLGEKMKYKKILDIDIPHYILPVTKGRNMSEIIEAAIIDFKLKKQGYNSAKKFNELVKKFLVES